MESPQLPPGAVAAFGGDGIWGAKWSHRARVDRAFGQAGEQLVGRLFFVEGLLEQLGRVLVVEAAPRIGPSARKLKSKSLRLDLGYRDNGCGESRAAGTGRSGRRAVRVPCGINVWSASSGQFSWLKKGPIPQRLLQGQASSTERKSVPAPRRHL
jgi:hypothetical protein